jgi:DNA-binding beta-propeller fold protein YncE
MTHWKQLLALMTLVSLSPTSPAATILLSANDGIETFDNGAYRVTPGQSQGSLSAIDISALPFRVLWTLPAEQTAAGPPSSVAVTPDGLLAIVSNMAKRNPAAVDKRLDEKSLQVFDLSGESPRLAYSIDLEHRPWGISMDPSGQHGLVANGDGTVTLLAIKGKQVTVESEVTLGAPTLQTMATAFTKDGRYALVTRRGDATVSVLQMDGNAATPIRDIAVGSNPYEVVVSPDGNYAAVSDLGHNTGDRNSVTLIDLRTRPFRAIDVFSVGPTPEGIAFSPDSTKLAVNSINGSNLPRDNAFHAPRSLIQVFDLSAHPVRLLATAEAGANAQGLAFSGDGKSLVVQDFASDSLLVFDVDAAGLIRFDTRVPLAGAPSGLAVIDAR